MCSGNKTEKFFANNFFKKNIGVFRCNDCGFVFLDRIIDENLLDKFYSEKYRMHGQFGRRNFFVRLFLNQASKVLINMIERRRIRMIKKYLILKKENKILDLGCTEGDFLTHANQFGSVYGLEVSNYLREVAKSKGINILGRKTADLDPTQKFDTITYFHVLEHLTNPVGELISIRKHIADDGLVICEVPLTPHHGLMSKEELNMYFNGCHLNHFSESSIEKFIELTGYEVLELKVLQFKCTLARRLYSKSNPHYLHPCFATLYKAKVSLPQKVFSLLSALELTLKYLLGFNVFESYESTTDKEFKLDLTNEIFFVLKPKTGICLEL